MFKLFPLDVAYNFFLEESRKKLEGNVCSNIFGPKDDQNH